MLSQLQCLEHETEPKYEAVKDQGVRTTDHHLLWTKEPFWSGTDGAVVQLFSTVKTPFFWIDSLVGG